MNPDANPNAPNAPYASARPAPTAGGGLRSTLRVAVPLVALVAVVFGITLFLQYTPTDNPQQDKSNSPKIGPGKPPLNFFTSARAWDPPKLEGEYKNFPLLAPSAARPPAPGPLEFTFTGQDRVFQGFYEPGEKERRTQFWFENPNPSPVTMELKGVSCTACSGGRVVAFPPELTRNLLQHAAVASLPVGAFNPYGVGLVQPAAGIYREAQDVQKWPDAPFANYREAPVRFAVPAADPGADKWSPRWGFLELNFKVGDDPTKTLKAVFATQVEGTQQAGTNEFHITFHAAKPFELSRAGIELGKIDALSGERDFEVVAYSLSRGPGSEFGDLDPPSVAVQTGDGRPAPGTFVDVGKPARVPEAGLIDLDLKPELKSRVRAAYKFTVAVRPKAGGERPDIGLLDRVVSVAAGGATQQLKVSASVAGPVWLDREATEINLGNFNGYDGATRQVNLVTENPGAELELLREESKPEQVTYALEKRPESGGRGHYTLAVTVPKNHFGGVRGEVVLRVKGPNPQKMRIPVKGDGRYSN